MDLDLGLFSRCWDVMKNKEVKILPFMDFYSERPTTIRTQDIPQLSWTADRVTELHSIPCIQGNSLVLSTY